MTIQFCSFASGSSGNCYLVKDDETAILIDAGISGKKILNNLEDTDTPRENVTALLVTHEHIDHVQSLPVLSKRLPNVSIYANLSTWENISRPVSDDKKRFFKTGEPFQIGNFTVKSFPVSHDAAEPVGFSIVQNDMQVSILTDSGFISDENLSEIAKADVLVLESNHEVNMLRAGRYPYHLQQRILSDKGHLSNDSCSEYLTKIVDLIDKPRQIILGHLSHENNYPSHALLAAHNALSCSGTTTENKKDYVIGNNIQIRVAARDKRSEIIAITRE